MRSFPTAFTSEKNKKTDLAPVWILRLTVSTVDYFLSDNTFSIASWLGGVTTLPWIRSWGQLTEGISGGLDEFNVTDFTVSCLIDPDDANNMEHLATAHNLEESPAELYLWFHDLDPATNPPQQMFVGYVKEPSIPDDLTVDLVLEDESVKRNNYVGQKIDVATFPDSDRDEIGKVLPEVFGTVTKLRSICVVGGWVTSIISDIAATDTSIVVSELPYYYVDYLDILIDDEQIYISAYTGTTLTVVRGCNGTFAAPHTKGSTVMEKMGFPLVYLLANTAVDAIGSIMAQVRGVCIDITADVTKYLGTTGNEYPYYPGKAAITITDFARVSQKINLALLGDIAASDLGHGHSAAGQTPTAFGPQTGSGTTTSQQTIHLIFSAYENQNRVYKESVATTVSFAALNGNITAATLALTVNGTNNYGGNSPWLEITMYVRIGGYRVTNIYTFNNVFTGWVIPISGYTGSALLANVAELVIGATGDGRAMAYDIDVSACISAATRQGTYIPSGVTVANNYSGVSISNGTLRLSGNSVADIMLGDMILADVTRNVTAPDDVIQDLLTRYGGGATLTTVGTIPSGYTINGAITEYRRLLEWCNIIAFQCRCYFRMSNGGAQLIVRPDTLTSAKTINYIAQNDGLRVLSRTKAPLEEVINKITILFDRDWTKTGDEAYRQTSFDTVAASIKIHGVRERPELFQFDFITSNAMAASVRDFYLAWHAVRRWRYTFDTFLDHCELEFGDVVTLGFLANQITVIKEARVYPGDSERMDKITFITEA